MHAHTHEGATHVHIHYHHPEQQHTEAAHTHAHLSVTMGVLHGLAGAAHVLGVLPAVVLPTVAGSLAYLAAFGMGSICSMSAYGWGIGRLIHHAGPRPYRWLLTATSSAALAVGAVWLIG